MNRDYPTKRNIVQYSTPKLRKHCVIDFNTIKKCFCSEFRQKSVKLSVNLAKAPWYGLFLIVD